MDKIPLTKAGFTKLNNELRQLKSSERPNIIKAIAEAREHGDLSENAEYHAAKEKQSFIEGRIKELESIISLADIINVSKLSGPVKFGATVELVDEETEENQNQAHSKTRIDLYVTATDAWNTWLGWLCMRVYLAHWSMREFSCP